jgi:hypothetical protein
MPYILTTDDNRIGFENAFKKVNQPMNLMEGLLFGLKKPMNCKEVWKHWNRI